MAAVLAAFCDKLRETVEALHDLARRRKQEKQVLPPPSQADNLLGEAAADAPQERDSEGEETPVRRQSLVVRALSGTVVLQEAVDVDSPVSKIVEDICERTGSHRDAVQLCSGGEILRHTSHLSELDVPQADGEAETPLELTLMRLSGPPITAEAMMGSDVQVIEGLPPDYSRCHFDRNYIFLSLGDFAGKERMRYLLTSNDDKMTPSRMVMWKLEVIVPVVVYVNFRSDDHVNYTGARTWLEAGEWKLLEMKGTVTTGQPNGPYTGPVYSKAVDVGTVELMGSNCGEGTYFVFIEVCM